MTKLEFVNKFIFQLFFIRLTKCRQKIYDKIDYISAENSEKGYSFGYKVRQLHTEQWYSLMFFVYPFTGWNTKFKYIGKRYLKRITKRIKL